MGDVTKMKQEAGKGGGYWLHCPNRILAEDRPCELMLSEKWRRKTKRRRRRKRRRKIKGAFSELAGIRYRDRAGGLH